MSAQRRWWHTATIYEVYPASFKDSNGDGIGDIPGLISRVEYLRALGIDAVWLAACFRSGKVDVGYDVVDFQDIDPQYGTVKDVEELIAELKRHNMRLILDMVVNHTSDQHPWFQMSRSSKNHTKRSWYIWRKGRQRTLPDGRIQRSPPNNWESIFKGPAWEYDQATDEWYLCIFGKNQPDLNWDRFEVRTAMHKNMMFWLDKGVAGFRLDVVNMISKPEDLEQLDAPVKDKASPWQNATSLYCNGAKLHECLTQMRQGLRSPSGDDIMLVGEVICTKDPNQVRLLTDPGRGELDMAYTYDLFSLGMGPGDKFENWPWAASEFKNAIIKWQTALAYSKGAWQTVWLESHDSGRSISRFGIDDDPEYRFRYAKLLALLQSTLGGTLFLYQGQEIGMVNLDPSIPISEYPDVETQRTLAKMRSQRAEQCGVEEVEVDMHDAYDEVHKKARDHARMPLPWTPASDIEPHAGFSSAPATTKMWSPMNTDSDICNINSQHLARNSVLQYWRKCLGMRKKFAAALIFGDFEVLPGTDGEGEVFAYWRLTAAGARMLVVLNLTPREPVPFTMPQASTGVNVNFYMLDVTYQRRGLTPSHMPSGSLVNLETYQGMVFIF